MKIRIEIEVGPTELREFLGLPDVISVQQEALDAVVQRLRSGAATGSDAVALVRGMLPEGLASLGDWQKLVLRALQTGRPVSVETTVKPGAGSKDSPRGSPAGRPKRSARKKTG